jgi:PHP domain-containing protein
VSSLIPTSLARSTVAIGAQRSARSTSVGAVLDLACVVHCHSTYSDGTGTVPEIAAAAERAGADVVLLTDHDTMQAKYRGEEGRHGSVLVGVGFEVSPRRQNHYLAFGLEEVFDHTGMSPARIAETVRERGGIGFAAHPFSQGAQVFRRAGPGMPWRDLEAADGLEVWSLVTDVAENLPRRRDVLRFLATPERVVERPPARNLAEWDRLGARRRVVGIGGIDAHQIGIRVRGRVPLRLMAYHRSFALLRTHVLIEGEPSVAAVYEAMRGGRCYLALDHLGSPKGFEFPGMGEELAAGPRALAARVPRPASLSLLRDGAPIATAHGTEISAQVSEPGVYRVEATLPFHGRERAWILSNPVYLRAG